MISSRMSDNKTTPGSKATQALPPDREMDLARDATPTASPPDLRSTKKHQTGFLDLPIELREQIYNDILYDREFDKYVLCLGVVPETATEPRLDEADARLRFDLHSYCNEALARHLSCRYYASSYDVAPIPSPLPLTLDLCNAKDYEMQLQFVSGPRDDHTEVLRKLHIVRANVAAFVNSVDTDRHGLRTACLVWHNGSWTQLKSERSLETSISNVLTALDPILNSISDDRYIPIANYVLQPLGRLLGEKTQTDGKADEEEAHHLFEGFEPGNLVCLDFELKMGALGSLMEKT